MWCSNFWTQATVSYKQIPTLQSLLLCCNEDRLIRAIMRDYVLLESEGKRATSTQRGAMEQRLAATLEEMRHIPIRKKKNRGRIFLPTEYFALQESSGLIERSMQALLVSLDDYDAAQRAICALEEAPDVDEYQCDDCSSWPWPYNFLLESWKDTLASRVWLGGPWCCYERYAMLANSFWGMTFFGFDCKRVEAKRTKAQASPRAKRCVAGGFDTYSMKAWMNDPPVATLQTQLGTLGQDAALFGLDESNCFEEDYRVCLARRVALLNRAARVDFWRRFIDMSRRIGVA